MASTYLSQTFSTPDNSKIFTWSFWVKRSKITFQQYFYENVGSHTYQGSIAFSSDDKLFIFEDSLGSGSGLYLKTNRVFRDTSAWYHIVIAVDTTQATSSNRVKLYINGEQETSFSNETYPSQNHALPYLAVNDAIRIGYYDSGSSYFDGILAHVHFIDGTAYDASAFGETDSTTGIWKPKTAPSVTYGTNGFFLKFENSGAFGTDSSGNSNTFTVNGTMTQTLDTPSNVFCTMNPLLKFNQGSQSPIFSNGNLQVGASSSIFDVGATLGVSSGKYYWEVKCGESNANQNIGVIADTLAQDDWGFNGTGQFMYNANGNAFEDNVSASYGNSWTTNDIIGVALDMDNGNIYFSKNGTFQNSGDPTSGASGTGKAPFSNLSGLTLIPFLAQYTTGTGNLQANFGNGYFGTTAVSSAQNPDDGIGIFEYSVPTGYRALCTKSINAEEYS